MTSKKLLEEFVRLFLLQEKSEQPPVENFQNAVKEFKFITIVRNNNTQITFTKRLKTKKEFDNIKIELSKIAEKFNFEIVHDEFLPSAKGSSSWTFELNAEKSGVGFMNDVPPILWHATSELIGTKILNNGFVPSRSQVEDKIAGSYDPRIYFALKKDVSLSHWYLYMRPRLATNARGMLLQVNSEKIPNDVKFIIDKEFLTGEQSVEDNGNNDACYTKSSVPASAIEKSEILPSIVDDENKLAQSKIKLIISDDGSVTNADAIFQIAPVPTFTFNLLTKIVDKKIIQSLKNYAEADFKKARYIVNVRHMLCMISNDGFEELTYIGDGVWE